MSVKKKFAIRATLILTELYQVLTEFKNEILQKRIKDCHFNYKIMRGRCDLSKALTYKRSILGKNLCLFGLE